MDFLNNDQSGVDRTSVTETVGSGSICGQDKPNTIYIGIYTFPAIRSPIKGTV